MNTTRTQAATQSQKLMIFVLTMALSRNGDAVHGADPQFPGGRCGILGGVFPVYSADAGDAVLTPCPRRWERPRESWYSARSCWDSSRSWRAGEVHHSDHRCISPEEWSRILQPEMAGIAAITGTAVQLFLGMVVDILKVQFAVEDFEAVPGLPESVFAYRGLRVPERSAVLRHSLLPAAHPVSGAEALW